MESCCYLIIFFLDCMESAAVLRVIPTTKKNSDKHPTQLLLWRPCKGSDPVSYSVFSSLLTRWQLKVLNILPVWLILVCQAGSRAVTMPAYGIVSAEVEESK